MARTRVESYFARVSLAAYACKIGSRVRTAEVGQCQQEMHLSILNQFKASSTVGNLPLGTASEYI